MIAAGDPGAPEMPDICTAYPNVAVAFSEKGLLANFDETFGEEELAAYIPAFVEEGRMGDGLYVFPIAKSTEVLYLNQTLFDRFAAATGASADLLSAFEGIAELSRLYYEWTDAETPETAGDGKAFYAADSWFNVAQVGSAQLGASFFDSSGGLPLSGDAYGHIFDTLYAPAASGGFAVYDGYSSDLSKTGDIVCSTGSSAGILFYGDAITYADGTVLDVAYSVLPYPVFEGGAKIAIQRGGGLMAAGGDKTKESAAAAFIKWLTAPEQNMRFVSSTGYLPVTKAAFENELPKYVESAEDERIKKMLRAVTEMYGAYAFMTAPTFEGFDARSKAYEKSFKALLAEGRERLKVGLEFSPESALDSLKKEINP
jgi:multiple sugar transport system substrate-binding protein